MKEMLSRVISVLLGPIPGLTRYTRQARLKWSTRAAESSKTRVVQLGLLVGIALARIAEIGGPLLLGQRPEQALAGGQHPGLLLEDRVGERLGGRDHRPAV